MGQHWDEPQSLRAHVRDSIGNFLYRERFPLCLHTPDGILALLDALPSYTEEGVRLYPEVVITTSLEDLVASLVPHRILPIRTLPRTVAAFATALKHCAPLARDGWIIFIELSGTGDLRYGVISSEASELSPSLYRQLAGDLAVHSEEQPPKAYIRCVGPRRVQVLGNTQAMVVQLSLDEYQVGSGREVMDFSRCCSADVDERFREMVQGFLARTVESAIQRTHGTLMAVIKDDDQSKAQVREAWSDGLYLEQVIDLVALVSQSEEEKSREVSTAVRSYAAIVQGMISQDGLIIFSSSGRVVAYNVFVRGNQPIDGVIGGARARAFKMITESGLVTCCMSVSHDGGIRFWEQPDARA